MASAPQKELIVEKGKAPSLLWYQQVSRAAYGIKGPVAFI
jgi:hypothetical protein